MRNGLIVLLAIALAASVAAGLAGLWPNLRGRSSLRDRRERARIAHAVDKLVGAGDSKYHVSRVRLDYLPGRALVLLTEWGHTEAVGGCALVAENFGDRVDPIDVQETACDF
jgi:hypothetical protein